MADTVDALVRFVHNQGGTYDRAFQPSRSSATVNASIKGDTLIATNTTIEIGNLGGMAVASGTNTGQKFIGIENEATVVINVQINQTSSTGQTPIAAGGFYLVDSTSVTGLHLNNPSTTSTAQVRFRVFDT